MPRASAGDQVGTFHSSLRSILPFALLGEYVNIATNGLAYGAVNHQFDLPLVNWLRNPALYPNDPIREALARFPTLFWPAVAYLSHWFGTEAVLWGFSLLTKLILFVALARLVAGVVENRWLVASIILAVAVSPYLNTFENFTPFGASTILDSVQTHSSLAVAMLVAAGVLLVEGRWTWAALVCALSVYVDALFFLYMLFAFAVFALVDLRARRGPVLQASLVGAAISVPWLILSRGVFYSSYPSDYVKGLLAFYPFHLRLSGHDSYDLLCGTGLILAALFVAMGVAKAGLPRQRRLELLAASFLLPVSLGAICGEFFLTPTLARVQLLRADTFLVLFCVLLIQVYGANLLLKGSDGKLAATFLTGALAIVLPLSFSLGLLWPLFIALGVWAGAASPFEKLCRVLGGSRGARILTLVVLLAGIVAAGIADAEWSSTVVILLVVFGGCLFVAGTAVVPSDIRLSRVTATVCVISALMVAAGMVPGLAGFWRPVIPPRPLEADWRAVQRWAGANTPMDAQFLVPTYPGGFREFSQRSSWGEWKDGQAMYHYPPFTDLYRRRMQAVGLPWEVGWRGTRYLRETYRRLPWERLQALALENHLSYIIQFRDVNYPVAPVYANASYAVYKVPQ